MDKVKLYLDKIKKFIRVDKIKKILFGRNLSDGLILRSIVYLLLISIGFVYLYPMLYMLSYSFMKPQDITNPMVIWVPTELYFENFNKAIKTLKYFETLLSSLTITLVPAIIQTIVCSLIGYGFARYNFPLKKTLLFLVLLPLLYQFKFIRYLDMLCFINLGY